LGSALPISFTFLSGNSFLFEGVPPSWSQGRYQIKLLFICC
jgi:hypothetical protein